MSLYKGTNLISGHQVLYSTTGNNTDGAMTQAATTSELNNKVDLNYSNADYQPVDKAGDTMTGNLLIDGNLSRYQVNGDFPTSTPSSDTYVVGYEVHGNGSRIGLLGSGYMTNGDTITYIQHERVVNDTTIYTAIRAGIDTSGNAFCDFPKTTCVDGQWVMTFLQLAQSVSIASNGTNSYSLANYLPNDNYYYEVILDVMVTTGTRIGDSADIMVGNSAYSGIQPRICFAITRVSGQSAAGAGQCILIIPPNDRRVVIGTAASHVATLNLVRVHGYRRIGTNS